MPEDMQGPDAMTDEWVSVPAARQTPLTPAAERKTTAAAERAERASSSSTEMPVRQPLEAVDVDAPMTPVIPVRTLIQPAIPWATRKKERPTSLEWLSAPQHAPRNRNIDDWLKDDSQHRKTTLYIVKTPCSRAQHHRCFSI